MAAGYMRILWRKSNCRSWPAAAPECIQHLNAIHLTVFNYFSARLFVGGSWLEADIFYARSGQNTFLQGPKFPWQAGPRHWFHLICWKDVQDLLDTT
jgi:hypothetical protein